MKIAVRMDDITPEMDWKKFNDFKALLDEYGIRPLIGVVPDNQDPLLNRGNENYEQESRLVPADFWEYVRRLQKQGWIIAMHGYRHVYTQKKGGLFPLNHFSEFAGLPYSVQLAMLEKGKNILKSHGIETDIFMAPAHSYDKNTLKALKQTGFSKITDGFGTGPYIWNGMSFYPISFRLENSLKRKSGMTAMVVHANTMSEKDMDRYRRIFKEKDMISYGEYLNAKAVKRGAIGRGMEYMLAWIKYMLVKLL
ncbi:MAG TPA: polysaccharide deacetylase [Lachnospiraceae bacterium]|nr:polysaccharide deacetylase [Lachnospiraceae bacterium]